MAGGRFTFEGEVSLVSRRLSHQQRMQRQKWVRGIYFGGGILAVAVIIAATVVAATSQF